MLLRVTVLVVGLGLVSPVALRVSLADPPGENSLPMQNAIDCSPPISRWAIPSDTGHSIGYYVGGGCGRPFRAEARLPDEGTWGWDYQGWIIPRRVILGWWHGRSYQDGTGAYKTDGPKLRDH